MFIHAPLPHVPRHCFITHYLTGQFIPARNAKHCPNPPKFLLVHTKADLRHSDVDYLVYRLPANDMKPVWFPLLSLWMVNINSVSPAFLSSFNQGLKMKTAHAFLWKTPQFHCKTSPCLQFFLIFLRPKQKAALPLFLPTSPFQNIFTYKEEMCLQMEWEWKRSNLNMPGKSCWREMGK